MTTRTTDVGADTTRPTPSDREIVISRVIAAPRALVFRAFTDPDQVVRWWGPNGFTTTTHGMDVGVGGEWRFTMHGPDGVDYPNRIVYREISEPARLAYMQDDGEDDGSLRFETTVLFEEVPAGTLVTLHSVFPTAELRDHVVREYGAIEGGEQTLERLAEHVEERAA